MTGIFTGGFMLGPAIFMFSVPICILRVLLMVLPFLTIVIFSEAIMILRGTFAITLCNYMTFLLVFT